MNTAETFALRVLRKVYAKFFGGYKLPQAEYESDPDMASDMIYGLLEPGKPCMIARFGSTELLALVNYLGVNASSHSVVKFINGEQPQWWWEKNVMDQMQKWSGFFPSTQDNLQRFGDLMMADMEELDLLGCWLEDEARFAKELSGVKRVQLRLLEPFWAKKPWSRYLKGRRVVVVHPFADDITAQYHNNREKLFDNPDILPKFASLRVVKAVQSLGGEDCGFSDWFEALKWMENEVDKEDYDVCLIGCGAYGFPLAAHVKRSGKQAIHLGGALQLLFGIKGKRWEDPEYGVRKWGVKYGSYVNLFTENWVRPGSCGRPSNANQVEGACYW